MNTSSRRSTKNVYPLNPTTEINPLGHLKRRQWNIPRDIKNEIDFDEHWTMHETLHATRRNKIVWVKHKQHPNVSRLIKIYKTHDKKTIFLKRYHEFVFVHETRLLEYSNLYHNRQMQEIYIVMPYYGASLKKQIAEHGATHDEHKAKVIVRQIHNVLWIMHLSGFVHCDIKPSNIVKREFNDEKEDKGIVDGYKLIDFELIHKNNSKGKFVGTMGWTSPEIDPNSTKNVFTYSSDIFAFGLVILYLLFGCHPLQIPNKHRRLYREEMKRMHPQISDRQIKCRLWCLWHKEMIMKSEHMLQNHLVQLYYQDQISYPLFHLLFHGLLVYDARKRWTCKQIYHSKWFQT